MIKLFTGLFLIVSFQSSQAFSADQFRCVLVDNFDDWSVELSISEASTKASFFDNDHWTALSLVEVENRSFTGKPKMFYTFLGQDKFTASKVKFRFNLDSKMGELIDRSGSRTERTYAMKCASAKKLFGIK